VICGSAVFVGNPLVAVTTAVGAESATPRLVTMWLRMRKPTSAAERR
jgi:hypothetical protein